MDYEYTAGSPQVLRRRRPLCWTGTCASTRTNSRALASNLLGTAIAIEIWVICYREGLMDIGPRDARIFTNADAALRGLGVVDYGEDLEQLVGRRRYKGRIFLFFTSPPPAGLPFAVDLHCGPPISTYLTLKSTSNSRHSTAQSHSPVHLWRARRAIRHYCHIG